MQENKLVISSKKFRGDSSVVSVRLPNDLIEKLDAIAEKTGNSPAIVPAVMSGRILL